MNTNPWYVYASGGVKLHEIETMVAAVHIPPENHVEIVGTGRLVVNTLTRGSRR